jgi:hypothetical protein
MPDSVLPRETVVPKLMNCPLCGVYLHEEGSEPKPIAGNEHFPWTEENIGTNIANERSVLWWHCSRCGKEWKHGEHGEQEDCSRDTGIHCARFYSCMGACPECIDNEPKTTRKEGLKHCFRAEVAD